MLKSKLAIAIDGPAAAGKSTVAKIVAKKLQYIYIDTGAMYRAITHKAIINDIDLDNGEELYQLLKKTTIDLQQGAKEQKVFLDSTDVTEDIRNQMVTNKVSVVAQHGLVRKEMVKRQRELSKKRGVVMDGRDIGSHVIPDAEVKIFLIASVKERAERRHKENTKKGYPSDLKQLENEIERRDQLDTEREISPLVKASDAIEIDTTSLSIQEVSEKILEIVKRKGE
ncbi:cytidylate kinase [Natronobacillus azotifigens]|uniref:Cytidylate kinase n=1 Tax=Natronobacillus azotifigens TaxID=472978 RepID=A0A9J6R8F6_9BACI|nr:(d)CMP kinase [Natronobacillus azotifigens]MCZ0701847.1 (d)CMP kinase [Natronobacillus azotifigens]